MDSYEFNKIAGALLASLLVIIGVQNVASIFYSPESADPMSYPVEVASSDAAAGGEDAAVEEGPSLAVLLASADASKGEKVARKCVACHTFEEGGENKVGPNLFGIVGRTVGAAPGFAFSDGMANDGGIWTYERLNDFIAAPKTMFPDTKMSFAGERKEGKRADLLAYLASFGATIAAPTE